MTILEKISYFIHTNNQSYLSDAIKIANQEADLVSLYRIACSINSGYRFKNMILNKCIKSKFIDLTMIVLGDCEILLADLLKKITSINEAHFIELAKAHHPIMFNDISVTELKKCSQVYHLYTMERFSILRRIYTPDVSFTVNKYFF